MRRNLQGPEVSVLFNAFILNTGLSLCLRRLSCVKIYKSANDRIVLTGIKAELGGKKKILSVSQFIEACNCIYACHLSFKLLQIKKNRILSLFRREEMFVRILTEWIITSSGSC